MNINDLMGIKPNELPLDNIISNGGYTAIFNVIACIGDSLSAGELEKLAIDEKTHLYYDFHDLAWIRRIGDMTGVKTYNFSRGGMTAKEYMESFADLNDYFNPDKKARAYIIALGVNDLICQSHLLGSILDIDLKDYHNNQDTFAGNYAKIIQKYQEIEPDAYFFLVTMPNEADDNNEKKALHQKLLYELSSIFKNTYVIDLFKYGPIYDAKFKEKFFLLGHMNPAGYQLTAYLISSYIDYLIRKDFEKFTNVGFIGFNK